MLLTTLKTAKVYAQRKAAGNLVVNFWWRRMFASKERLWNHSFISTMPLFSTALCSRPDMNLLKYRFMSGSKAFKEFGPKEGLTTLLRNAWFGLFLVVRYQLVVQCIRLTEYGRRIGADIKEISVDFPLICFGVLTMDIIYSVDISEYDMIRLNTNNISCLNYELFLSK